MAEPTLGSLELATRLASYLVKRSRLRWWYEYQDCPRDLLGFSDSDWAGWRRTRKSTSGGAVKYGRHLLKVWSRTQDTISLSSAGAELYAGVNCSAEVLGPIFFRVWHGIVCAGLGDASAAIGIIKMHGLGKPRHISRAMLWVQQTWSTREVSYGKFS